MGIHGMSVLACVVGAVLISSLAVAAERGLVGYWDFEEGSGKTLHDKSGNGNHGKITGGAKWVKGVRGWALSFNGVDGMVQIKRSPSLNMSGDVTVMAWVRALSDKGRDRIIFGDGASLAVNRNVSVIIDSGFPYLQRGNGVDSEAITPDIRFDGTWTHLAVVYELPRWYFYWNGKLVRTGRMIFPMTPTHKGDYFIGGWWAGKFKGEIDEVKVYNRALAEREIVSHHEGKPVAPQPELLIDPRFRLSKHMVAVELLCRNLGQEGVTAAVAVSRRGQERPLQSRRTGLKLTRPDSERVAGKAEFSTRDFTPGPYQIRATLKDVQGKALLSGSKEFNFPKTLSWLGSKRGISDKVLAPYTPVRVERGTGNVEVWGRTYSCGFGKDGAFLSGIRSREADMLAGPARFVVKINGKEPSWRPLRMEPGMRSPAKAVMNQGAAAEGVTFAFPTTVEYDGLAKAVCRLTVEKPVTLDSLMVEIPLSGNHARYLYTWPTATFEQGYSGALKSVHVSEFKPMLWTGDEERGLSWFWESAKGWSLTDPKRAIEVIRMGKRVLLRFNLVNKPVKLTPENGLEYTFAFQATPLKPIEKDGWDYRIFGSYEYGDDYGMLARKLMVGKPELEYMQEKGCRTFLAGNWTKIITYPWPMGWEKEFKALVKACHRHGIKVIPYLGYQICEEAPDYPFVRDEVIRVPLHANPDSYPGMRPQMVNIVCLNSAWQDCLVENVARMIDEFDIDGVYLDSTPMPWPCNNELHGCGYRRADGKLGSTYPIFAVRETFKRLYTVIKAKKPDGIVDAHVYDCMNSAALAFATSYWNGEQLRPSANEAEGLPLDRFRAEMMGVNWGVPADFLHYRLGDFKKAHALSLLHDVLVRTSARKPDLPASICQLADKFGRKEARFLPYWNNAEYIKVTPKACYASLYRHPESGVLVLVSNLGKGQAQVRLAFDLKKLGLPRAGLVARDGLTGEPVAMQGDTVTVTLPPMGWQYLWIKAAQP